MLPARELTEVAHVKAQIAVPVQAQDPLQLVDGDPAPRGDAAPAIEQAVIAIPLVAPAQAAHRASTHAQDLRHLNPT